MAAASPPERGPEPAATQPQPPVAPRMPHQRVHHGDLVIDDYEWLRDKESPDTISYLEAENAYTTARTAHLEPLREQIFSEIRSRTQETDLSVPVRVRGWWYYSRTVEGRQYALSCRRPATDPEDWTPPVVEAEGGDEHEQVLIDANALAEGHDFFALGASAVSPDGRLLAFSTDTTGDERFELRVKDLTSQELLPDRILGTTYGATWDLSGTQLFYTTVDEAWRADKVWRHRLGTDPADDVLVHHETDERFWVSVGRSRSNRFLVIGSGSKVTTEYRLLDAGDPTGQFLVVAPRRQGVEYAVEHAVIGGEDVLLVLHNDGAENFELARVSVADVLDPAGGDAPSHDLWERLVPHDPAVRLEDVDAFADHLVVSQRSDGLTQLRLMRLDEAGIASDELLPMEHPLYTVGLGGNPEFTQPTLRFGYTTMATPPAVYDLDLRTGDRRLLKQTPVLGGFDPAAYEQHRTWATADDGTAVPISVVVPAGVPRDGSVPLLLYGYGAYETSIDPFFTISRLSLLDRGMGFAIAHVRGGGELGRHWYEDGKLLHKRNTFTDFVACARHLAETGWTSPERLVAEGGSAGGLLMGAAANMAPEAFAGILAEVPFVDALTTILDPDLPLTVVEWEEWGNPLEDPEVYAYMKSYTPYENVGPQRYPALLAETSLHDTRVYYVEPAKWVARLRATAVNGGEVLLKTEMAAGHGGVSGRYNAWRDRAFSLAWVLDQVGLAASPASGLLKVP